jgi:hypothetical protein
MPGLATYDWEAIFAEFAALPAPERSYRRLARQLGARPQTVLCAARRGDWAHRLATIDARAQEQREARAVRQLADRLDDTIRLVEAMRLRFAQRLADSTYLPSASEFVAMAKLELQIESLDRRKMGGGAISDEFRQALERLPRYVKERIIIAELTGKSTDEILELERGYIDVDSDDDEGPRD